MIAIIGAMECEVNAYLELLDKYDEVNICNTPFYKGKIHNQEVVIMLSGIGKVNSAMNTTLLLNNFDIELVISTGVAAGLLENQKVLDLLISNSVVQHDYDTSPIDGVEGLGKRFSVNQTIIDKVTSNLEKLDITYHIGCVASGDQFIASELQLNTIIKNFPDAICAEMESGSIANVCNHFNKDYIVIRSVSDNVTNKDSHIEYLENFNFAAKRSAKIVKQLLEDY